MIWWSFAEFSLLSRPSHAQVRREDRDDPERPRRRPRRFAPLDLTVHTRWRRQADAIIDVVSRQGAELLDRQVPLAGRAAIRRPLREALVQRNFETWVHAEDVRRLVRLAPRGPSPQQVTDIVGFALRLLPGALHAAGRAHPAAAIRLVLSGDGGGDRAVGLAPRNPGTGTVVAEVAMPSERFCRLLAGRLPVSSADARIEGDPDAARDFLTVAATMGCE